MRRHLLIFIISFLSYAGVYAQNTSKKVAKKAKVEATDPASLAKQAKAKADKALSSAKENLKRNNNLEAVEKSMRELLADSFNCKNEKVWLTLFQAVKKQYEQVNENLYLKQQSDTAKFFNCTLHMFDVLESLDSIDTGLDRGIEGKNGTFRSKHAKYLARYRSNLYSGGAYFLAKNNFSAAYQCFDSYLDCARQPLFGRYKYAQTDARMPEAAYWAVFCAYKMKDPDKVLKYETMALKYKEYNVYLLQYLAASYNLKDSTERYVQLLAEGFEKYPTATYFFPRLVSHYAVAGDHKKVIELSDKMLFIQPKTMSALMSKCYSLLCLQQYDECVAVSDEIVALDERMPLAYLYAGMAYYNQTLDLVDNAYGNSEDMARLQLLYKRALPYLEKYRELVPADKEQWAYPLYNIYYTLNMGDQFEEIEKLMDE